MAQPNRAANERAIAACDLYDLTTIERLYEHHGSARSERIINGMDHATNVDLIAWHNLGGRRGR